MAFVLPNTMTEFVDNYPDDQLYNRGSDAVGGNTRNANIGATIKGVASNPRVREFAGNVANLALDKANERLRNKGKGNPNNGRSKTRLDAKKGSGDGDGNGNGGSNSTNGGGGGGRPSQRGFQKTKGTSSVSWSSGIRAGLIVNPRLTPSNGTTLYLASGWLFKVTDTGVDNLDNPFDVELKNIIYPLFEQIISNNINRWAGQYINEGEFSNYVHAITKALQVYYTIDSVLAYTSNNVETNINPGMDYLRDNLSASVMVEFNLLKEALENTIAPPVLLEFIRFMAQNYRTSDAPHAPIIRLNLGGLFDGNWVDGISNTIEGALRSSRLDIRNSGKMISFLNRAFPSWIINDMPPSAYSAVFDKNFFTFWVNMNCCYKQASTSASYMYTHALTTVDDYMNYQIMERDVDVDGTIFASYSSFFKNGETTVSTVWGIWQPLASDVNKNIPAGDQRETFNLKCFAENNILSVKNDVMAGRSGVRWSVAYTGSVGSFEGYPKEFGTHGFVPLQVVSPRMQNEAFNNSMRLWFNPPTK